RRRDVPEEAPEAETACRRRPTPEGPRRERKGALMDRILSTHAGSLVRPQELLDFLLAMEAGEDYDQAAYEQALAEAVKEVVRGQAAAGIDGVDDGARGRSSRIVFLSRPLPRHQ